MKQILVLMFLLTSLKANAQIAVKVLHFNPTGDQGVLFEKRFTGEIMYINKFNEEKSNFRTRIGLGYASLNQRLDSVPSYAVHYNGNETSVLPGYEIYHKYNMGYIFAGMDWAFLNKEPFFLFLGADVIAGSIKVDYEAHYETVTDEYFSGGQAMGGLRFRVGAQYMIGEKFSVFAECSRSYYIISEYGGQSHFDYGLGVQYLF